MGHHAALVVVAGADLGVGLPISARELVHHDDHAIAASVLHDDGIGHRRAKAPAAGVTQRPGVLPGHPAVQAPARCEVGVVRAVVVQTADPLVRETSFEDQAGLRFTEQAGTTEVSPDDDALHLADVPEERSARLVQRLETVDVQLDCSAAADQDDVMPVAVVPMTRNRDGLACRCRRRPRRCPTLPSPRGRRQWLVGETCYVGKGVDGFW